MNSKDTKQAKGGRARAAGLSKARRSEIAKNAAGARWEYPRATYSGELRLGGVTLECAVLEDGSSVFSESSFMEQLGMYRSGALSTRRQGRDDGEHLPLHLAYKNLREHIVEHFGTETPKPFKYRTRRGNVAHGIRAETVPTICEVWLDARKGGGLGATQERIADLAEILIRGFARVGVIALVHEATGYQYERQRNFLEELLEEFLSDKLRRWVKTFPNSYFRELCRLRGVTYRSDMRLPPYFGHLTNDIVYKRLPPGLLEKLQELNPREKGRRKSKHHQWLSGDAGHPKLMLHLGTVTGLMKASASWDEFYAHLERVAPPYRGDEPLFAHLED